MATADKSNLFSNLFRDIGKPGGSIAPTTMLAIAIVVILGLVAGGFFLHSRIDKLHSRLDKLETDLTIAKGGIESRNERLMSLQREISQIRQDQSSAAATIARLDNRSSTMAQPTSPQNTAQPTSPENTAQPTSPESNVLQITAVEAK